MAAFVSFTRFPPVCPPYHPRNYLTPQAVSCMNILHDFHENNSLDRLITAAYILYQAVG
jgi:hypothetical protein